MRIGQPGMERYCGHLNHESEEEQSEHECLESLGCVVPDCLVDELEGEVDNSSVVCCGLESESEDTDEHNERCHVGVDEELDCRIVSAGPSVPGDHEVHGDESYFPHNVEQEVVCRKVDSHQPYFHGKEQGVVVVGPVLFNLVVLRSEYDNQEYEDGCENDHQDTQSVNRECVVDNDRVCLNPFVALSECSHIVRHKDVQREEERDERECHRHELSVFLSGSAHEERDYSSDQGDQNEQ